MHILVDVVADRLHDEIVDLLVRAGHTIERGRVSDAVSFDLALVGTAEAAAKLKAERPYDAVVVVTKVGDIPARVRALEAGADDSIDRAMPMAQMMARVTAAGRRAAMIPRPRETIEIDGCVVDLSASTATRAGVTVPLTQREVELVRYFARQIGQVVSRAELLQNVWRVAAGSATRAVDVAIVALRAKVERDPEHPTVITTVRGTGYRWG